MARFSDIPVSLRFSDKRVEFLSWLSRLPVPASTRLELYGLWCQALRAERRNFDILMLKG